MIRDRVSDEIIPVSAEQSATHNNNGAGNAIDMNIGTFTGTIAGSDGRCWLKVNLGKVFCVQQVIWFDTDGSYYNTWTCLKNDCSCSGPICHLFTLTVSTEEAVSDLPSVSDCKYGDVVELERTDGGVVNIFELAIIGKSAYGK